MDLIDIPISFTRTSLSEAFLQENELKVQTTGPFFIYTRAFDPKTLTVPSVDEVGSESQHPYMVIDRISKAIHQLTPSVSFRFSMANLSAMPISEYLPEVRMNKLFEAAADWSEQAFLIWKKRIPAIDSTGDKSASDLQNNTYPKEDRSKVEAAIFGLNLSYKFTFSEQGSLGKHYRVVFLIPRNMDLRRVKKEISQRLPGYSVSVGQPHPAANLANEVDDE